MLEKADRRSLSESQHRLHPQPLSSELPNADFNRLVHRFFVNIWDFKLNGAFPAEFMTTRYAWFRPCLMDYVYIHNPLFLDKIREFKMKISLL